MYIKVSKQEILENSNDYELGKLIRTRYWEQNVAENPDEHLLISTLDNGNIVGITNPVTMLQTCSICGDSTYHISSEYLIDTNHLECALKQDNEYDSCVLCGRATSYKRKTPIDFRIGYVEGAGQTCDGSCRKV